MCELQLQGAEPVVFALVAKYKGAVLQNIYMQRAIWDDNAVEMIHVTFAVTKSWKYGYKG